MEWRPRKIELEKKDWRRDQTMTDQIRREALHPETRHGVDRGANQHGRRQVANSATCQADRFTSATAKATGKAE